MRRTQMERFEVSDSGVLQVWLNCKRCDWEARLEACEPLTLAELVQRAEEHTEVCR